MSLIKTLLKENIDSDITNIVDKLEETLDIDLIPYEFENVEYMDEGSFAQVYAIRGKNKVIRFSYRQFSMNDDAIMKIIDKDIPNVVKIYYHRAILIGDEVNQITVMEELEPLSSFIESWLITAEEYQDGLYWFLKHGIYEDIDELEENFEDNQIEGLTSNIMYDVFEQLSTGIRMLEKNGIRHEDIRWQNIMEDNNGNVKIIDLF